MLSYEQMEQALAREELTLARNRMRASMRRTGKRAQAHRQARAHTLERRSQRTGKALQLSLS